MLDCMARAVDEMDVDVCIWRNKILVEEMENSWRIRFDGTLAEVLTKKNFLKEEEEKKIVC